MTKKRFALSGVFTLVVALLFGVSFLYFGSNNPEARALSGNEKLLTVYDKGDSQVFLTEAGTVGEALKEFGYELDEKDAVEPSREEKLVASDYKVNIFRAKPVTVVDGLSRKRVVTPYQTPERIAQDAELNLFPEDVAEVVLSEDILQTGAGLEIVVNRAKAFNFSLFAKKSEARTQGSTVGDMLKEKGISLTDRDRVEPSVDSELVAGMDVRVWREGVQTVTVEEEVEFGVEKIYDADRTIYHRSFGGGYAGYKEVKRAGENGIKSVTYEVEMRDGVEVRRTKIVEIVNKQPVSQLLVVGKKNIPDGLTKGMGVKMFKDGKGVTHRETYYDLPMNVVMRNCGKGGKYYVREDGVKVDDEGYVIIAAHLGNYPRCSIVETSLGAGKVYDTGTFAETHAHGFDIATDWTRADGV